LLRFILIAIKTKCSFDYPPTLLLVKAQNYVQIENAAANTQAIIPYLAFPHGGDFNKQNGPETGPF
jgi:hypothetical protein